MIEFISSFWSEHLVGRLHFILAMVALFTGPVVFRREKGTRVHRILGYVYVLSMLCVNISALTMYKLSGGFNLFHFFAITSLITIVPGWLCAVAARVRKDPRLINPHYFFMSWSYYGLLAAFISQVATQMGDNPFGLGIRPYVLIGVGTGLGCIVAALLIHTRANRILKRFIPSSRPEANS